MIRTLSRFSFHHCLELTSILSFSSASSSMARDRQENFVINLVGDVMIGRLIDQLLPTSVDSPEEAAIVRQFRLFRSARCPYLQEGKYDYATIWGNTLSLWKQGNFNIINLETSVTTDSQLWPGKVFNYRTHPSNVACLTAANIHHVSLANNHTLDFSIKGLEETCDTLDRFGITYVGAGKTREQALGPVFVDIPHGNRSIRFGLLSASDHPSDWSTVPSFHLLPHYDLPTLYNHLQPLIEKARTQSDFVIFSVHWGPNYQWVPDRKIQELARWMIHQGVDLIHGHSSHHLQGIELIQRNNGTDGIILYGCGDFLDDYAIDQQYRNDLGALFQLHLNISSIRIDSLSIYPTRCSNFQVNRLSSNDHDFTFVKDKLAQLSHINGKTFTIGRNDELVLTI